MLTEYTNKVKLLSGDQMQYLKCKNPLRLFTATCILGLSTSCFAETGASSDADETITANADSVYEWGLWELGIQPAAAAPAPSPQRAVTPRIHSVQFRPNDNNTFAPDVRPVILEVPASIPVTAPVLPGDAIPTGTASNPFPQP